ncbi:MAG: hypothetical protein ACYC05_11400 [Sulfuricella sp.]|nr:hypothetical protein [Gammaproteobacteria bacterium]
MYPLLEFLSANAALLVAVVALVISLRANYTAHQAHRLNLRSKADSDRVLLFEKKREVLNEVDRQHARIATLKMLTAQKILLFRDNPDLQHMMPGELDRLRSNLTSIQTLDTKYEEQRQGLEAIDVGADIAKQEELLANIRRLSIHLEKDIAHEQAHLDEVRSKLSAKMENNP